MKSVKVSENAYWVGSVDWTIRNFHGNTFKTSMGTTYNAYLLPGEKNVLIDTVAGHASGELFEKIEEHVPLERLDAVVMNHVETDHSGALPALLDRRPGIEVIGTKKCREGLSKHYFREMNFREVKTGDAAEFGKNTLRFIEAPMLHWPDSMFTYLEGDRVLFPNDAFGQHYASGGRFGDEAERCPLMEEAKKYYANILWPFSSLVLKKIEELLESGLEIRTVAPSHGVIWRENPLEIVELYRKWASQETLGKAVIVYETMWGATSEMARVISEGLIEAGAEVKLYDVNRCDLTAVFADMIDAAGWVVGSSTHDNSMLPGIAYFLHLLRGMKPSSRAAAAFGSFGWGGGAVREIEEVLEKTGARVFRPSFSAKYRMNEEEKKKCLEFGKAFAGEIIS